MSSIYIQFVYIAVPLLMMIFFVDKKSKIFILYMCIGCVVCLLSSEVNALMAAILSQKSAFFITVNITPVVEEVLKALPILVYALFINDDKETLVNISMVTGIGFAILENNYLYANAENATLLWALIRGLGAGFMHGLSTLTVGFGLSYIRQKRGFLFTGVIGLLATAIIFHGTYNAFVQSSAAFFGYCYPIVILIIIKVITYALKKHSAKDLKPHQSDSLDEKVAG